MSSDTQACDRCHRRKTKCDKIRPGCGPCAKAKVSCQYSERVKEPVYRREVVEKLERRVRQLESNNRALTDRLSSKRSERPPSVSSSSTAVPQADGDARNDDDVANEVSFLAAHAGGDRNFLGSSSGILFASLVKASVANVSKRDANGIRSAPLITVSPRNVCETEWSVDESPLPPKPLAKSLVEAYLAHDHISYPFLLPESVRSAVDLIYNDGSYYRKNAFEAFMFNMLLAIGTSQVYKFNWQALPDAETHHLRAMTHLDAVLCQGGLKALQAMLLLCQFRLTGSTQDTSGSLWHLVGIAVRMCFELGLHREALYRLDRGNGAVPIPEENEVCRRCFWCVFSLDRVVSITLGRPLAICTEDIDVGLPKVNHDEIVSPSTASVVDDHEQLRSVSNYGTAIFVHIIRYRALCGKILTSLHRGSRRACVEDSECRELRNQLAIELEAWRAETSSLNLPEIDLSAPLAEARSSFRSKAWHELLYHNGILLLYRPSPALSLSDPANDDRNLDRLFSAAKQSITLYAYLFRSRKINFTWVTLHAVFMAGLSYVYAVSRHFRERRKHRVPSSVVRGTLSHDPSISEIVSDCRTCSNVLVAVSERCNAQKNCHEVFDRLSDALLADAVETLSQPGLSQPQHQNGFPASWTEQVSSQEPADSHTTQIGTSASQIQLMSPGRSDNSVQHENQTTSMAFVPPLDYSANIIPLAADNALRDCFPDLQRMYDAQCGDDAILQLSTDWLGEIYPRNDFGIAESMGIRYP